MHSTLGFQAAPRGEARQAAEPPAPSRDNADPCGGPPGLPALGRGVPSPQGRSPALLRRALRRPAQGRVPPGSGGTWSRGSRWALRGGQQWGERREGFGSRQGQHPQVQEKPEVPSQHPPSPKPSDASRLHELEPGGSLVTFGWRPLLGKQSRGEEGVATRDHTALVQSRPQLLIHPSPKLPSPQQKQTQGRASGGP